MATVAQLQEALNEIMLDPDLARDPGRRKFLQQQFQAKIASMSPKGSSGASPIPGMVPAGATVEGVNYKPEDSVDLAARENALKRADLIASRYNIPFVKSPAKPGDAKTGAGAAPEVIDYRRGTASDFMSGSNPYETYTSGIPAVDGEAGIPPNYRPAIPARPAMYFGHDLPAVPISQQDYMNVMQLQNRAATIPDISQPLGQATPQPLPPILPTPRPVIADQFQGIPVARAVEAGVIDPMFQTKEKKQKIDKETASKFFEDAGGDVEKARQLARSSGYYW